jgi:hypothetical protein
VSGLRARRSESSILAVLGWFKPIAVLSGLLVAVVPAVG